ncbi:hypothetical protein ACFSCX_19595 [Bacillus salitolerans]|uniref:Uncharacterized protein n=1 Tax=Bacillus salitolerans TaxID=1437434 RepID=A0ABW4LU86_9BACI
MTVSLYSDVMEFQKTKDDQVFARIYKKLGPKINYSLLQTRLDEREDLKQELSLVVYEKVLSYSLDEVPGFEEFEKQVLKK